MVEIQLSYWLGPFLGDVSFREGAYQLAKGNGGAKGRKQIGVEHDREPVMSKSEYDLHT